MFLFLLIVSLLLISFWIYIRHRSKWELLETIPGPPGYPIIGNMTMFMGPIEQVTNNLLSVTNINNRYIKLWLGLYPIVIIVNANDAELILKSSKNISKSNFYEYWKPLVGDSLFTISYGPTFRRNKKLIVSSLGSNNIKEFFDIFNTQAEILVKILSNKTGRNFDISSDVSACLIKILLETVLGYSKNDLQKKSGEIVDIASRLAKRGMERHFKFWIDPDFMFWLFGYKKLQDKDLEYMNNVMDKIIKERCQNKNSNDKKRTVFIDTFLDATDENGPIFSHKQIKDEILTIIFAGQDTTSSALGFSLCLLGLHENVQEKLYEEIVEKLGKNESDITYEKTKEMVYLGQVIQETLRLYPSAPAITKVSLNDIELADGQIIPKDTIIAVSLYHIQRNRDNYTDPDKFDPDNFTPERSCNRHSYSYIPFSGGIRKCIGQTYSHILMKLILAKIILNFKIYSKIKQEDFKLSWEITLKRPDGFLVTLEPRGNNN